MFGVIGYVFKKLDYPLAPMVLALVLGDMAESSFRQSMLLSNGQPLDLLVQRAGGEHHGPRHAHAVLAADLAGAGRRKSAGEVARRHPPRRVSRRRHDARTGLRELAGGGGMSYRTILVPVGQPDNAESAIEAAFLVARRFAGHVHGLHVLPDLANPVDPCADRDAHDLEEASSDLRKFKGSAERELKRQSSELKRLFETAAARAGAPIQDAPEPADRLVRIVAGDRPASRASWSAGSAASSTSR